MSKFLNLTPMVLRGKGGELVHSPCALFKSTFLQKSDFDYWEIDGSGADVERAFEKLKIHYSSVTEDVTKTSSNPRWKWKWIRANLKELGVFNWSLAKNGEEMTGFEIIDDWGGEIPLDDIYSGMFVQRMPASLPLYTTRWRDPRRAFFRPRVEFSKHACQSSTFY